MSGYAHAGFLCGAAGCSESYEVCLISDGYYPHFHTHDGWHIELGADWLCDGVIRCPDHCEFVGESIATGGYWKDAP